MERISGLAVSLASMTHSASRGVVRSLNQSISSTVEYVHSKGAGGELHAAAMRGDEARVRELLAQGADVNCRNKDRFTPLYTAAVNGRVEVVKCLCEHGAKLSARMNDGYTALFGAAMFGQTEVVRYICKQKVNVNAWSKKKLITPQPSQSPGGKKKDKKKQNKAEAKPQYKRFGETALHVAAAAGQADICEILCKHGANVHFTMKDGSTPLHCVGSRLEFVQSHNVMLTIVVLLQHGAKFSARNKEQKSAITVIANRFPADEFLAMMEKIRDAYPELLPVRDIDGLTLKPDEWRMVLNRLPIERCKIFLLGNGGSGKSSLSAALQLQRKPHDPDENDDDPTNPMTRTYGMEYELFGIAMPGEEPDKFCIQDPGGLYQPHLLHNLLFQAAYGIYIIVVRADVHTLREVKEQIIYWLRFVEACARPGGHVILMFSGWAAGSYIEDKLVVAQSIVNERQGGRADLHFEQEIWYMDCRKSQSEQMNHLRARLSEISRSLQAKYKYTMPYACGAVEAFVTNKRLEKTAEHDSRTLVSCVSDLYLDFQQSAPAYAFISEPLFLRLCEYVQQIGSLLLLPGSWLVLDANIITKYIFGQLFRKVLRPEMGEPEHMLTVEDINRTTVGHVWFENADVVPMLMQEFDLCVQYPTMEIDPIVRYFPCFIQQQLDEPARQLANLQGKPNLGIRVQFEDPDFLSFRSDFTARLFMELYLALTPPSSPNSKAPQLWSNAALLKTRVTVQPAMGCEADESAVFHKWLLIERHPLSSPGFDIICTSDSFDVNRVRELLNKAARMIEEYVLIRLGVTCQRSTLSPNPELVSVTSREALDADKLEEIQQTNVALHHYLATGADGASRSATQIQEVLDNLYDTRAQLTSSFEQLKYMESKFNDLQTRFQFPEEYYPTTAAMHRGGSCFSDAEQNFEQKEGDSIASRNDLAVWNSQSRDDLDDVDAFSRGDTNSPVTIRDEGPEDEDDAFFDDQSDYDGRYLDDDNISAQAPVQAQSHHTIAMLRQPSNYLEQAEGDIP